MELLNKNIAEALDNMDIPDTNKKILKAILYKEHCNRGLNKDKDASAIVDAVLDGFKTEINSINSDSFGGVANSDDYDK